MISAGLIWKQRVVIQYNTVFGYQEKLLTFLWLFIQGENLALFQNVKYIFIKQIACGIC